jgi:hypothetical protein
VYFTVLKEIEDTQYMRLIITLYLQNRQMRLAITM